MPVTTAIRYWRANSGVTFQRSPIILLGSVGSGTSMMPLVPSEPAFGLEECADTGRKAAAIRPSRKRTSAMMISPLWPRAKVAAFAVTIETSLPTDVARSVSCASEVERPASR